jgi:uncharacterized protein (TIGR01319 family)
MNHPQLVLAVDVGSTTTKATLLEAHGSGYRGAARADAPTTVEKPELDVMIGVRNAIIRLERASGRTLLGDGRPVIPPRGGVGVDLFVATSSAGGGLQMLVTGLVKSMTAESAQRAALGAGAIVADVLSFDDARLVVERVLRVRELRPDMILLTGGTDEGQISHVGAMAEFIAAADPQPRFGQDYRIPVIYAGNIQARDFIARTLGGQMLLSFVDNIRPTLEREVLEPAREEIHRLFLEHVMAQAPGYRTLLEWTGGYLQPTPMATGKMIERFAAARGVDVLGVDIGGATTDVFSVAAGRFTRTVSANLGMSYSLGNVLVEASPERILSWLPYELDEGKLRNWNFNKMIRPTTLPETLDELLLEHAVAREALRLAFAHHRTLAVTLKGVQQRRNMDEVFDQSTTGRPLIDIQRIGAVIGSGGVLSHAPRWAQAALLLIDALQPEGCSELYVDRQFLMPHLGALSELVPERALHALLEECLVPLGTVLAPSGDSRPGRLLAQVEVDGYGHFDLVAGQLAVVPVSPGAEARVLVRPGRGMDVGKGQSRAFETRVRGGAVGLILDGRGRPITLPSRALPRRQALLEWLTALGAYPRALLERYWSREVV